MFLLMLALIVGLDCGLDDLRVQECLEYCLIEVSLIFLNFLQDFLHFFVFVYVYMQREH